MATITEDYVSFETAKLLREKGFKEPTLAYAYGQDMVAYYSQPRVTDDFKVEAGRYPLPTLQMACKWLREVQNLFVFPFPQVNTNKFWAEIYQLSDNQEWENLYCESIDLQDYLTYEAACEAAIKYCLENLI